MMSARLGLLCLSALVLVACGNQDEDGAVALWDDFHAADYRSWEHAPGWPGRTPSGAAHGEIVEIYINDVLAEALASGEALTEWPDGSLIVKDGFAGEDLNLVAAMEKRGDEWFWAEYDHDGTVTHSGSPGVCKRCHDSGADYVRAFGFK